MNEGVDAIFVGVNACSPYMYIYIYTGWLTKKAKIKIKNDSESRRLTLKHIKNKLLEKVLMAEIRT